MNNLQPNEEQLITGNAVGSWQVSSNSTLGDILTFTVTDTVPHVVTYTVQPSDLTPPPNIMNPSEGTVSFQIALNAASALNAVLNPLGYTAAAAMPADIPTPPYFAPYTSEVIITGPSNSVFTIAASVTGTTNLIVDQQVYPSPIAATVNGVALFGYVPVIDALGMRMASADLSLWISKADVVDFRRDEVRARVQLYRTYCEMLSRDLGGKEYVNHFGGGPGGGAIA